MHCDRAALVLSFSLLPATAPLSAAQPAPLTARKVVERIQQHVGVPWREDTVDTFKAGDPGTTVAGIAVTMMATQDVLERAAAAGVNLVITHEPTFYGHFDKPEELEQAGDKVLAAKRAFIDAHHLVVWRFHDHWHMRRPDGIQAGMVQALGWQTYQNAQNPYRFTLPETTLAQLAGQLGQRLAPRALRVVGDPQLRLTKVALAPGAPGSLAELQTLEGDDVEVLVLGETREWETVEYVADAAAQGRHKALVLLGHVPSEQAGMEECTRWLKTFVTEVPVQFVPTREPFWQP
jgi:putative NIF3 family GTP cyclohydrolase 1 type 2